MVGFTDALLPIAHLDRGIAPGPRSAPAPHDGVRNGVGHEHNTGRNRCAYRHDDGVGQYLYKGVQHLYQSSSTQTFAGSPTDQEWAVSTLPVQSSRTQLWMSAG